MVKKAVQHSQVGAHRDAPLQSSTLQRAMRRAWKPLRRREGTTLADVFNILLEYHAERRYSKATLSLSNAST